MNDTDRAGSPQCLMPVIVKAAVAINPDGAEWTRACHGPIPGGGGTLSTMRCTAGDRLLAAAALITSEVQLDTCRPMSALCDPAASVDRPRSSLAGTLDVGGVL